MNEPEPGRFEPGSGLSEPAPSPRLEAVEVPETARGLSEAAPRRRVAVTGSIVEMGERRVGSSFALRCVLADRSGQVALLFLGRHAVPGLFVGASCSVEGMVSERAGELVVWNPRWRPESQRGVASGWAVLSGDKASPHDDDGLEGSPPG